MPKAKNFALVALLLGSSAISAHAGWFDFGSSKSEAPAAKDTKAASVAPAANLEDSIRQAQMLRLAGSYPEAIKHLSQLMMIASDDPRVVSEYGKTLAAMGRAQDAVNFLTRAQQLQPNDWTVYSALGVSYDQLGNQKDAQLAYEHALALKPGEPSVLNNYALSRMLAKDPETARKLAARAEIAGGASDAKIAANIAMIRSMAPEAPDAPVRNPAPSPVPRVSAATLQAAPRVPVAANRMPQVPVPQAMAMRQPAPMVNAPLPMASNSVIDAQPQMAQAPRDNRVVMQRVPEDPLAGPVGPAIAATHAPRPLQFKTERATAKNESAKPAKAEMPQPASSSSVKTAASQAEDLQARAEAIAKQLTNKPAAIAAAKAEANKVTTAKPESNKVAAKPDATPKAQASKDLPATVVASKPGAPAPKVLPPAPVKAADAKPATPAATKTAAAKPKDSIPGLRMSANAY